MPEACEPNWLQGKSSTSNPVSYTHLDVYKRQAVDLAAYYQNYINIGQRECQLGLGLDISNVGSKINFGGDENSEFLPANLRVGASLMVPVDEYNRFSIAFDAKDVYKRQWLSSRCSCSV